jgi:hypothetical protein
MKKTLLIVSTILYFSLLITSCSKNNVSPTNTNDLTGTKWVNNSSSGGLNVVETLSFTSASTYSDVAVLTGTTNTTLSGNGTYIYTPPTLIFTINGSSGSATINGNNLYAPSLNGTTVITYIKQ